MTNKKVFFDLSCLANKHITGIGVYASELANHFPKYQTLEIQNVIKFSKLNKINVINNHLNKDANIKLYSPINDMLSSPHDIFHGPDYKMLSLGRQKKIVTVHDIQTIISDQWSDANELQKMRNDLKNLLHSKLDAIIVPTISVKSDIEQYYPTCSIPIFAIHHGLGSLPDTSNYVASEKLKKMTEKPYFLCLGTIENRKNHRLLIEAFLKYKKEFPSSIKLLIGGGLGFGGDAIKKDFENTNDIIFLGRVSNDEKGVLLSNMIGLTYPSLYEGFGLPLVEAMPYHKPILTSQYGAMKEVTFNQATYCDPKNIDSIVNALDQMSKIKHYDWTPVLKNFNWITCAQKHMDVYKEL